MEDGSLENVVAQCRETFGRVVDATLEGFNQAMSVSCHDLLRMAKAVEPLMTEGGAIMIYLGAERVVRNYGLMGVIKAALESAVRYMAHDLGPQGIRVFSVSLGPIMTCAASGINNFNALLDAGAHIVA